MKKPKISDLVFDETGTKKIRKSFAKSKKIKITINIDEDVLKNLKHISKETDVPYQTLLNKLLRQSVDKKSTESSRLDRLEKQIAILSKKISA